MLLSLAFALLTAAPADTAWGSIRGVVQSEPSGKPLALAVVEVQSGGHSYLVTSDTTGIYQLARVPAGRQLLRVRHLEHEPVQMEVLIPARNVLEIDVGIRHRPLALDTLQVRSGVPLLGDDSIAAARDKIAVAEKTIMEGSGVGSGLPGTRLPGGGEPPPGGGEPGDVLFVRGSAADLKLVLLDGAPVYAPFHMGGLIESFEPGLLSGARLYLGGAPARYDGGVSYVLDLSTRSARDGQHAQAALDMVSARGVAEGPLFGGATYLVAGRVVHGASLARLEGEPFPYRFTDGLVRIDVPLAEEVSLALTGFLNGEGVRLDTSASLRDHFARWSNQAASLRLQAPVLGSSGELTVAVSDFDARLPQGSDPRVLLLQAATRRARVGVDLSRRIGDLWLGYGYSYDRQWVRHRARERTDENRQILDARSSGTVYGWYLDGHWEVSPRWVVRGGMRSDMFSSDMFSAGPFLTFSPRASVAWVTEKATLTLAGGRYHQYIRVRNPFPFDIGVPSIADSLGLATQLAVAGANHLSLALDQKLNEGVRLGIEGHYKRFDNIPDEVDTYTSGVDVWVRRGMGPLTGWLGYSLSWYWSHRDSVAGRQMLSAGIGGEVGRGGRFEVRVAYGAGLPYTSVGVIPDGNALPGTVETGSLSNGGDAPPGVTDGAPLTALTSEDFLRLDAQLSRTWTPTLGGRKTELTPYLRVINALDRRDGLFYNYNPERGDAPRALATLPLLPVFGVEWKF